MPVTPGPGSSGVLLSPALQVLDGLVDRLVENQRAIAALEAERAELFAAAAEIIPMRSEELRDGRRRMAADLPARELVAELATALRIGERAVQARLTDASLLVQSFPCTLAALRDGCIDPRHVAVILDAGASLEDLDLRARFEELVLPIAARETAARLRSHARELAARVDPEAVDRRAAAADERRTVRIYDLDDDLARLVLDQPATLIHAIYDRLTQQAKALRAGGSDPGTAATDEEQQPAGRSSGRDAHPYGGDRIEDHGPRDDGREDEGREDGCREDDGRVVVVTGPGRRRAGSGAGTEARGTADGEGDSESNAGADGLRTGLADGPVECDELDDARTLDQLRADILTDILLTGAPTAHGNGLDAIHAVVQVTVPLAALVPHDAAPEAPRPVAMDRGDHPTSPAQGGRGHQVPGAEDHGPPPDQGLDTSSKSRLARRREGRGKTRPGTAVLPTFGPIPIETARTLAGHSPGWERVCLDPNSGLPVAVDRYKPTARQRAYLAARDERCRFPGCRRPAHRCDMDHTRDAALGGATCICNLAHFCRRHHTVKHHTAWTVRQLGGGVLEWTSPTGRRYEDRPPTTVRFIPEQRMEGPMQTDLHDDPAPF